MIVTALTNNQVHTLRAIIRSLHQDKQDEDITMELVNASKLTEPEKTDLLNIIGVS
jgi:hypothetical protein